jgi:hypothetical protein
MEDGGPYACEDPLENCQCSLIISSVRRVCPLSLPSWGFPMTELKDNRDIWGLLFPQKALF